MKWPAQAPRMAALLLALLFLSRICSGILFGQAIQYQRPVDTAPQEKNIGGGYVTPPVQKPLPRSAWLEIFDVVLLAIAMGISGWLVLMRRSRRWLTIGLMIYVGALALILTVPPVGAWTYAATQTCALFASGRLGISGTVDAPSNVQSLALL